MIRRVGSLDGAAEIVRNDLYLTNAEALVEGAAYVVTTGRLTLGGTAVKPQYLGRTAITGGTDVLAEVAYMREDDIFEIDYTGTAPVVGVKTYELDATGLLIDGDATSGKWEILTIDTTAETVRARISD